MALSTESTLPVRQRRPRSFGAERPINQIQIRQMNTALIYDPMVNQLSNRLIRRLVLSVNQTAIHSPDLSA